MTASRIPRVAIVYDVLYPWVRGGVEKRYWEIAKRLPSHGFEPHLFGPKYWDGPDAILKEGVWLHGVCAPRALYSDTGTRTVGEAILFARDLFPVLLKHHHEIIDCCAFPFFPFFSARTVAAIHAVPILTTWPELWGPYWRKYLGPFKGTIAQLIERVAAHMSQSHACLSPFTEARLHRASSAPVTPIPAGIDAPLLARYSAASNERRGIIFIGRLLAHKRVDDLLHALVQVRQTCGDASLVIVGQGPEEARLRVLTTQLGLEGAVKFMSNLAEERLYTELGLARCLVLPSEREGQGIVIAEAQAVGTPPVVALAPESASGDFVSNGGDGTLYRVGDVRTLATIITRIVTEHPSFNELSATAMRMDWDTAIVPAVARLYTDLMHHAARVAPKPSVAAELQQ